MASTRRKKPLSPPPPLEDLLQAIRQKDQKQVEEFLRSGAWRLERAEWGAAMDLAQEGGNPAIQHMMALSNTIRAIREAIVS